MGILNMGVIRVILTTLEQLHVQYRSRGRRKGDSASTSGICDDPVVCINVGVLVHKH